MIVNRIRKLKRGEHPAPDERICCREPKANCARCYGRGFEGTDARTREPIECRCLTVFVEPNPDYKTPAQKAEAAFAKETESCLTTPGVEPSQIQKSDALEDVSSPGVMTGN